MTFLVSLFGLSLLAHRNTAFGYDYIGCYNDQIPRAMTASVTDQSFDACVNACSSYNYFARQNGGRQCFCGNDLSQIKRYGAYDGSMWGQYSRSGCGDGAQKGGGSWTNAVYRYNGEVEGSGAAQAGGLGGDGYNHFRVCEGKTATFTCAGSGKLHLGGCWYGSPSNDPGYGMCPHSAKGHCNPVTGNCVGYIQSQCEGKTSCSFAFTNSNMGGDPCPNKYKFGAVAIQCNGLPSSAQSDQPNLIEYNPSESDYNGDNDGYLVQFSSSTVYSIGLIVSLLLLVNIACLCYYNCYSLKSKNPKYRKVSQIASSDDSENELINH